MRNTTGVRNKPNFVQSCRKVGFHHDVIGDFRCRNSLLYALNDIIKKLRFNESVRNTTNV